MNSRHDPPIGELVDPVETCDPCTRFGSSSFTYIDIGAIDNERKSIIAGREIRGCEAPSRARQIVRCNDVLVSTVRPKLNAVAVVPEKYCGAIASTGFTVLRCKPERLFARYLYYWTRTPHFVRQMVRLATGANYPAVSDSIVKSAPIPLPPLAEQKRIAAILDKADAIRSKRQQALRLADEFLRCLFLNEFDGGKWQSVKLADVCTQITDGEHARPRYTASGIPFISVKDVTTGRLRFDDCKYISPEDYRRFVRRCRPEKGDILYTKVGTYGRVALVDTDREFSLYVSVALLKPKLQLVNPYFLRALLDTPLVRRQADRCVKGAGVPDLHLIEIKNFSIPLPPIDVQQRFVTMSKQIERTLEHSRDLSTKAQALGSSLASRAFMPQP